MKKYLIAIVVIICIFLFVYIVWVDSTNETIGWDTEVKDSMQHGSVTREK